MLGYSRDDLLAGKLDPATLIPPNGRDPAAAADVPVEIDGVRQPCESEYLRKDGSRVPVLVAVAPLEGDESLSLSLDLSERNRANEELRKSREALARTEKLRALGQMAAGVTHDVKNILNPLSLHLQIAQRANVKGSKETVEEAHQGMKQALAHGLEVLERLRNFSRQTPESKLAPVDLNLLAHEALLLAKPRLASPSGRIHRVHEEYGAPQPVLAEPGELVSAVLNLLANAADAMIEGGEITVRTGERDGGGWISVSDNGPGMSAEVQARAFEPFFTTKGQEGTGLGLAMVYAAVHRHGGTVGLESEPGKGATFTLWFPAGG